MAKEPEYSGGNKIKHSKSKIYHTFPKDFKNKNLYTQIVRRLFSQKSNQPLLQALT